MVNGESFEFVCTDELTHCEVDDDECDGDVTKGGYLGDDLYFCQAHRTLDE